MLTYVSLSLTYILVIQLVYKLYFKDTINLNLDKILGINVNNKVEFYLNKTIKLNKQMSIMWIWYIFIIIMFVVSIFFYALHDLCTYLDIYINVHITFYPNIIADNINESTNSLHDMLLILKLINYVSIIVTLSLIGFIVSKFHLNRSVNNIYIWLLILTLILTLAFTAYIFNDLFLNINNYVKTYLNLK